VSDKYETSGKLTTYYIVVEHGQENLEDIFSVSMHEYRETEIGDHVTMVRKMQNHYICIVFAINIGYTDLKRLGGAEMASTIQVRVDDELKTKADELFRDLGTDTTTAIRMFLTQALNVNGFPFEIRKVNTNPYKALTEDELLDRLEKSREHAAKGMVRDAGEFIGDMRAKYGL